MELLDAPGRSVNARMSGIAGQGKLSGLPRAMKHHLRTRADSEHPTAALKQCIARASAGVDAMCCTPSAVSTPVSSNRVSLTQMLFLAPNQINYFPLDFVLIVCAP